MAERSRYDEIIKKLKSLSDPNAVEGMARFGINPDNTYGISIPNLRRLAKEIGKNHLLARELGHQASMRQGYLQV